MFITINSQCPDWCVRIIQHLDDVSCPNLCQVRQISEKNVLTDFNFNWIKKLLIGTLTFCPDSVVVVVKVAATSFGFQSLECPWKNIIWPLCQTFWLLAVTILSVWQLSYFYGQWLWLGWQSGCFQCQRFAVRIQSLVKIKMNCWKDESKEKDVENGSFLKKLR